MSIIVTDLTVRYGDKVVLNDISLEIESKRWTC